MYIDPELISSALGQKPADTVIKGGTLINVYTSEVYPADVAIFGKRISAVGMPGEIDYCVGPETKIIDASGKYLAPGLIDSHIHPEACKITMTRFANAALAHGTTTIMCPLDHTAVVLGRDAMRFTLDEFAKTPLKAYHSTPSRLPYTTPASTIAHDFTLEDHAVAQKWPEASGIWEYMASSVEDLDQPVLDAANLAIRNGLLPHGHMPMTRGKLVSACAAAGARDDHESYSVDEMIEKISNGLYAHIRRGTHSNNLPELIKAVTEKHIPTRYLSFCTDDLDCSDLNELGLIDYLVREAMRLGVDPVTAIQMGTINAAECYRVDLFVGSITPGRFADILILDDLPSFAINSVIANGVTVVDDHRVVYEAESPVYPAEFYNTCRLDHPVLADDLYLRTDEDCAMADVLCIHLDLNEGLLSKGVTAQLKVKDRRILCDPEKGINYITVTDRHTGKGKTAKGFISGIGLTKGAVATSLSPDDHNIICVGADTEDMALAINHLKEIGGGQIAVENGRIIACIPLPVAGLMSDISAQDMAAEEAKLNQAAYDLGTQIRRPYFFLMFLSITAIPDYAMTDAGLVEYASRSVVNPIIKTYGA